MFRDRQDAGRRLAAELLKYKDQNPIVVAVPRGGVPVGAEVARELGAPLDIVVVRKLGAPGQPELGLGGVSDGDQPRTIVNEELARMLGVSEEYLLREIRLQLKEVDRRQKVYRGGQPALNLSGRTVIVVDDGIATGGSIRAALRSIRRANPKWLVLAVPVAPLDAIEALRSEADDVVCLDARVSFGGVGEFYRDFRQTSDEDVIRLLEKARAAATEGSPPQPG
jgi:putative phosphoribosyl transferase